MTNQTQPDLYGKTPAVGLLKGFSPLPHQLEVDAVVPHHEHGLPGFGEFLLVELSATEALVGRVSRYYAAGQLATDRGDAYLGDLAKARSSSATVEPFSYFVQVGAFRTPEDAESQRAKLSLGGVEAKVTEREQAGRTVFRVRVGPFDKKEEADKAKEKLEAAGLETALVRVQR